RPGHESRPPPNRGVNSRKREARCAADAELAIRNVVVHVAFAGMGLAPCVLVRSHVLAFGEVGRALIQVLIEIGDFKPDPMRYTVVRMGAMVVCRGWISTGKGIDPCARTNPSLVTI